MMCRPLLLVLGGAVAVLAQQDSAAPARGASCATDAECAQSDPYCRGECGNGACMVMCQSAPPPTLQDSAPLWCPASPPQACRMACAGVSPCPSGQCNMRSGTCCESSCQAYQAPTTGGPSAECTGCCPEGAACSAPDPACCASRSAVEPTEPTETETSSSCGIGSDCGGQVHNACGSSCPPVCGEEVTACIEMCVTGFFCAAGTVWDRAASLCVRAEDCGTTTVTTMSTSTTTQNSPIQAVLTLAGDLITVAGADGTDARRVFQQAFSADVASALSIDASRVIIDSIADGSVVVAFSVMPGSQTNVRIAAIESAFAAEVSLPTVGVQTTGPIATVAAQTSVEETSGNHSPPVLQASASSRATAAAAGVVLFVAAATAV